MEDIKMVRSESTTEQTRLVEMKILIHIFDRLHEEGLLSDVEHRLCMKELEKEYLEKADEKTL